MPGLDDRTRDMRGLRRPADRALAELAERQHGVVGYAQLRRLGLGPDAIEHRARSGRLHRLNKGVYAVGRKSVPREGRWLAGVLACGPEAALSHRSAAALWGIVRGGGTTVDVTVPGRTRRGSGAIAVHNVRRLHADDRVRRDGIPVTSVARTLLDVAESLPAHRLVRAIEEAERLRLFDLQAIDSLYERSSGRHGLRTLRAAIAGYRPGPPLTRSELERRFAEICDSAGLPRPAMNLFVAWHEVDACWPDRSLVVEIDSFEYHRTRAAFERDRLATRRCCAPDIASCA